MAKQYNSNMHNSKYTYALLSLIYSIIATYCAGELSEQIARFLVINGLGFPIREQLNILMVVFFYYIYIKFYEPPKNTIKFGNLSGFFISIITILLILLISWSFMIFSWQIKDFKLNISSNIDPIAIAASIIFMIMHGFAEQFLIQKLAQQNFDAMFGRNAGILAAGFAFASLQTWQGYSDIIYIINSFMIGVLMAMFAIKFGIMAAATMHGLWTFFETQLLPLFFSYNIINKPFLNIGTDSYGSLFFGVICLIFSLLFYKYSLERANINKI